MAAGDTRTTMLTFRIENRTYALAVQINRDYGVRVRFRYEQIRDEEIDL